MKTIITLEIEADVKPQGALNQLFKNDADFRDSVLADIILITRKIIAAQSGVNMMKITVKATVNDQT